jgi:hypothetical protein
MTLTITLPEKIAEQLQRKAKERHLSATEVAIDLLENALDEQTNFHSALANGKAPVTETDDGTEEAFPTPEEVVAKIKALGPSDPRNIRLAQGSLAEVLRSIPSDPDFDFEEWNRQWAEIEAEMKAINRANDMAEGHI